MARRGQEAVRRLRGTLASPRLRRVALLSGTAYVLLYLFSLGHLVISPGFTPFPERGVLFFIGLENLWRERAPYNFEPIGVFQPFEGFALFLAVPNLLLGAALGFLLGLNVATLVYGYTQAKACGIRSVSGLFASVPAFLTGFACCSPTFVIILGSAFAASFLALLAWFIPAAIAALVLALAWNLLRYLPTPDQGPTVSQV